MVSASRQKFNNAFSDQRYHEYVKEISNLHPGALDFRNAETPVFVDRHFTQKMLDACDHIIDVIKAPEFMKRTDPSIPAKWFIRGEEAWPQCIAFDFGVCEDNAGGLAPQLIEMQGFPSLFCFQRELDRITRPYAGIGEEFSSYLNGYDAEKYAALLKQIIVANEDPENVILLEIYPEEQKTRLDFYCTNRLLGIRTICITKLRAEGDKLFYEHEDKMIQVKRIFNRMIFDDLEKYSPDNIIDLEKPYEVTWVPHPHWFYRISKFTLPFIDHPYVPETFFLNEVVQPLDLSEYVLKPLFSFAGQGVIIDVTQGDIDAITDPENWILQRKVQYAPVIPTPDGNAMAEIRLFYFWKEGWERPVGVHNLARLSKGKMIGTRYNKDKTWVGGSIAYFEK